tara:strand:- start:59 stop:4717 length:4659 start_codon:yes stop_codon:yes gene_type:complete
MGNPLEKNQIKNVGTLKHIFQNNLDLAKDYWQQLQDGVETPTLDREELFKILGADKDINPGAYQDAQRFKAYLGYAASSAGEPGFATDFFGFGVRDLGEQIKKREGKNETFDATAFPSFGYEPAVQERAQQYYDFTYRGMSGEQVGFSRPEEIAAGITTGSAKIAQGILETGALSYDLYNDDAETSALKWVESEFPQLYEKGELDTFLGKTAEFGMQYGTGYAIAAKLINSIVQKKGKDYLKKKTLRQKATEIIIPAAISEPFVSTSRDLTLAQAFGLYDSFVIDDENLSPRERAENLVFQKLAFGVEAPFIGGAIAATPKAVGFVGGKTIKLGGKVMNVAKDYVISPVAKVATKEFKVPGYEVNLGLPGFLRVTNTAAGKTAQFVGGGIQKALDKSGFGRLPPVKDWRLYNRREAMNLGQYTAATLNSIRAGLVTSGIAGPTVKGALRKEQRALDTIEKFTKEALESISTRVYDVAKSLTDKGLDGTAYAQSRLQRDFLDYVTSPMINGKYVVSSGVLQPGTIKQAKYIRNLLSGVKKEYATIAKNQNVEKKINDAFRKDAQDYLTLSFKIRKTGAAGISQRLKNEFVEWMMKKLKNTKEFAALPTNALRAAALSRTNSLIELGSKEGVPVHKLIEDTITFLTGGKVKGLPQYTGNILTKGETTLPEMVAKLYGRTDDVRERVLETVMELGRYVAYNNAAKNIHRSSMGKLFFETPDALAKRGIATPLVKLGEEFKLGRDIIQPYGGSEMLGPLAGTYTTAPIANAITRSLLYTDSWLVNPLYKALLFSKGVGQSFATVYSPVTQVRNVTSAGLFAVANGHFGKNGASLLDSISTASRDLFTKDGKFDVETFQNKISEYNRQGLAGSSLVTKELQLIAKEVLTPSAVRGVYGRFKTTDDLIDFLASNPAFQKLQRTNQVATQLYQLGDDIWKIFGYEFEKTRNGKALKIFNRDTKAFDPAETLREFSRYYQEVLDRRFDLRGFLDEQGVKKVSDLTESSFNTAIEDLSGEIIRNVYPNYNYVGTLIQNLRRIPLGNFISFPIEMIRTSFNISRYGVKELQSSNALIRQQGAERLIGFGISVAGFDYGLEKIYNFMLDDVLDTRKYDDNGNRTSGSSPDQKSDALQRSFVPSWNQEGPLPFLNYELDKSENKKGRPIIKYFNTAFQSPYSSTVAAPFYVALQEFEAGRLAGKDWEKAAFEASVRGFAKLLDPFVSETIAFQGLVDATIREGRTTAGGRIYYPEDDTGDKIVKSLGHIMKSFTPGIVRQGTDAVKSISNYFIQEDKDKYFKGSKDKPYNPQEELFTLFSGIRTYEVQPYNDLRDFHAREYTEKRSSLNGSFYKSVSSFETKPEEFLKEYIDYQIKNYEISSEFFVTLKDANVLGVTKGDIYTLLEGRSGLTQYDAGLLTNKQFMPRNVPSVDDFDDTFVRRARTLDVPLTEIMPLQDLYDVNAALTGLELGKYSREELRGIIDAGGLGNYLRQQEEQTAIDAQPQSVSQAPAQFPITQPQATAATPQVAPPVATGTTQGVTPTETALLSPTELAIRQRNKGTA